MKKYILLAFLSLILFGCTENQRVKTFGGSASLKLPSGQKLINATWKQDNLWILTRPMTELDSCQTYTFLESSSFGILEGSYTIIEGK